MEKKKGTQRGREGILSESQSCATKGYWYGPWSWNGPIAAAAIVTRGQIYTEDICRILPTTNSPGQFSFSLHPSSPCPLCYRRDVSLHFLPDQAEATSISTYGGTLNAHKGGEQSALRSISHYENSLDYPPPLLLALSSPPVSVCVSLNFILFYFIFIYLFI